MDRREFVFWAALYIAGFAVAAIGAANDPRSESRANRDGEEEP